jgi:polyferredoxin
MTQKSLRIWRRGSQILFFALFLFLLIQTQYRGSLKSAEQEIRLSYPVQIFLEFDPFVAITNILATGALYRNLFLAIFLIILTLFLGRFFCGWICPLGTLNHFFSWLHSETKIGIRRIHLQRYKKWQVTKYFLLIIALVLAIFGSVWFLALDPISLTVRSFTVAVFPGLEVIVDTFQSFFYSINFYPLQLMGEILSYGFGKFIFGFRPLFFRQSVLIGILFGVILLANFRVTRFWCRALCPLGALLGFLSRWSILGLEKQPSRCTDCNLCLFDCQGGDDPIPGAKWRKAECHLCFNCVASCEEGALKFTWFPGGATTIETVDLKRRKLLRGALAGAVLFPVLRSSVSYEAEVSPWRIRPPGALDEENFLERCIRCGECMKVCPNNALHPALTEAGLEGLWTPVLVPKIGYCEPSCVLCGQVCPTGAIWEISQDEKLGYLSPRVKDKTRQPVRIGTAFVDRGRCLPWAMARECIVCEEWCPISPKAIYLEEAVVLNSEGKPVRVRRPYVDPERCTGCGACEYACPVKDRSAIYVTSVGESRSRKNQFILEKRRRE